MTCMNRVTNNVQKKKERKQLVQSSYTYKYRGVVLDVVEWFVERTGN